MSDICSRRSAVRNVHKVRRQKEFRGKSCLHPEGQEVSGEDLFQLFAGCGGKGRYAVKSVHTPKGRACQERIDLDLFFACFGTLEFSGGHASNSFSQINVAHGRPLQRLVGRRQIVHITPYFFQLNFEVVEILLLFEK
jgi:hypothetical protein